MRLSAIQSAGDAIDATREYLFARSLRQYLLLSAMAIFLGPTGVGGPPGPVEIDEDAVVADGELPTIGELLDAIDPTLALAAIVGIAVLAVGYGLVSSFMEFGFVHSLAAGTVAVVDPARAHYPRALSLFVFRGLVWGLGAGAAVAIVADALGLIDSPLALDGLGSWLVLLGIAGVLYVLNRLTTDFVVPIMYLERCGLLAGWARLLGVIRQSWRQFAVYLPVRIILEVALGIAFGLLVAIAMVAIAIVIGVPVGVVLVLVVGPLGGVGATLVLLAVIAVAVVAMVMVPFHAYLRLYTLLVLGDIDATLDLIPLERRRLRQ